MVHFISFVLIYSLWLLRLRQRAKGLSRAALQRHNKVLHKKPKSAQDNFNVRGSVSHIFALPLTFVRVAKGFYVTRDDPQISRVMRDWTSQRDA